MKRLKQLWLLLGIDYSMLSIAQFNMNCVFFI